MYDSQGFNGGDFVSDWTFRIQNQVLGCTLPQTNMETHIVPS